LANFNGQRERTVRFFVKELNLKVLFVADHVKKICCFYCFENETVNELSHFEENSALCLPKIKV